MTDNRMDILKQAAANNAVSANFRYEVEKMLYQIKAHPKLITEHSRCLAYVYRFYTEKQPEGMEYKK